MEIPHSVVRDLLASRSPHVRRDASAISFTVIATIDEGTALRFGSGDWDDPALRAVTPRLVDAVTWKQIEHAAGSQVVVRCVAPFGDVSRAVCQVDLGDGWERLPIRED